jgi:hypothetical protein
MRLGVDPEIINWSRWSQLSYGVVGLIITVVVVIAWVVG